MTVKETLHVRVLYFYSLLFPYLLEHRSFLHSFTFPTQQALYGKKTYGLIDLPNVSLLYEGNGKGLPSLLLFNRQNREGQGQRVYRSEYGSPWLKGCTDSK